MGDDARAAREALTAAVGDAAEHPAVTRLRLELRAAWRLVADIQQVAAAHRERALADVRAGIPDVAGRAGRVDAAAAMAEIRAAVLLDRESPVDVWDDLLRTAGEAAEATVGDTESALG